MKPKHYLHKFHPKVNPRVEEGFTDTKFWVSRDLPFAPKTSQNPRVPTSGQSGTSHSLHRGLIPSKWNALSYKRVVPNSEVSQMSPKKI